MSEEQIVAILVKSGFVVQRDKNVPGVEQPQGACPLRLEHPTSGGRNKHQLT